MDILADSNEKAYKLIEEEIDRILHDNRLIEENQKILFRYYQFLSTRQLRIATIKTYLRITNHFGVKLGKSYNSVTEDDVIRYYYEYKNKSSTYSVIDKSKLRFFYIWLLKGKDNLPEFLQFQKMKIPRKVLTEQDLYDQEDIMKMIEKANNSRDKLIISLLWESGARASEVLGINIGDLEFNDYGVLANIWGKTGHRKIMLVESKPYIIQWLNEHPDKNNPKAPLIVNLHKWAGQRKGYQFTNQLIKDVRVKAGIKKTGGLHRFRHSRLNFLAKTGWKERDLRIQAGWTMSSKMTDVYLHYDEQEVHKKVLAMNGIKVRETKPEESIIKPLVCAICTKINSPDAKVCSCGSLLNGIEEKPELQDVRELDQLFKDKDFQKFYLAWKKGIKNEIL